MVNTLFGTKVGMVSSYDSRGRRVGASLVRISPNVVTQLRGEKDGYSAAQLGLEERKSIRKPQLGHLKKVGVERKLRFLREVRVDGSELQPGQEIILSQVFHIGDAVKVTGVSKGRGFQGGVKRYGFHGGPKTHGQSDRHRGPGSIGSGTTPGRVFKGKRMAGHYGSTNASLRGLEVLAVDKEKNLLTVKGGIPGPIGGLIRVENIGKIKGYTPPPEEKPSEEEGEEKEESQEATEQPAAEQAPAQEQAEGGENAS